jgi:hypothetical protein
MRILPSMVQNAKPNKSRVGGVAKEILSQEFLTDKEGQTACIIRQRSIDKRVELITKKNSSKLSPTTV